MNNTTQERIAECINEALDKKIEEIEKMRAYQIISEAEYLNKYGYEGTWGIGDTEEDIAIPEDGLLKCKNLFITWEIDYKLAFIRIGINNEVFDLSFLSGDAFLSEGSSLFGAINRCCSHIIFRTLLNRAGIASE